MTTFTESDLKELKDLIIDVKVSQGEIKIQLTSIDNRLMKLETKLETLEPLIQKIPDLAEKVGELKNWRQIGFIIVSSVFSGSIGGVIGWAIRGGR